MEHIGRTLAAKRTILLEGFDPVTAQGWTLVPNLILKRASVSAGAKLVYALLLSYAWHNDCCFPGQRRLAEDCGRTQGWVSQQMRELRAKGFLSIERRGQGKTNVYTLKYRVQTRRRG